MGKMPEAQNFLIPPRKLFTVIVLNGTIWFSLKDAEKMVNSGDPDQSNQGSHCLLRTIWPTTKNCTEADLHNEKMIGEQ